ncbi:MAG: hypothetical protein WDN26_03315 [Chitinophagaceae bacterium]
MLKFYTGILSIIIALPVMAQGNDNKPDNSFRIVSFVTLLVALFLAIWRLKNMPKK